MKLFYILIASLLLISCTSKSISKNNNSSITKNQKINCINFNGTEESKSLQAMLDLFISKTYAGWPKNIYSIDTKKWSDYKNILGIESICIPENWWDLFTLNISWNPINELEIWFENFIKKWNKSDAILIYRNNDFKCETICKPYTTTAFNLKKNPYIKVTEKAINLWSKTAYDRLKLSEFYWSFIINREIVIPFDNQFLAFDFAIFSSDKEAKSLKVFNNITNNNNLTDTRLLLSEINVLINNIQISK